MAYLPGTPPVGKSARTEHLGNITGRRGAGLATLTSGDPAMHGLNHYGKKTPTLFRGGSGGVGIHARQGGFGKLKTIGAFGS